MPLRPGVTQVMMFHRRLAAVPSHSLPAPYRLRPYQPGDERHWMAIKAASDSYHDAEPDYFEQTYGAERELLAERQLYLCDGTGRPLGTATAWYEDFAGARRGKVNWVLLLPEAQGRGLAKPLLSAVCRRLAELGHRDALLYTLTARLPAVNLYRAFGFAPLIRHAADLAAWESASPLLKQPLSEGDYLHEAELRGAGPAPAA